jgi:hypothetical protein
MIIPMQIPTWHYRVEEVVVQLGQPQLHQVNQRLDELGMQGWEAVTTVVGNPGHVFCAIQTARPTKFHFERRGVGCSTSQPFAAVN